MHIVFDLETTGLPIKKNIWEYYPYRDLAKYSPSRIIQICMQLYNDENNLGKVEQVEQVEQPEQPEQPEQKPKPIDEIYTFIDPKIPIPAFITTITNINDSMVKNFHFTNELVNRIRSFVTKSTLIIGHNVDFDIYILCSELYRLGQIDLADKIFKKPRFCTMKNASKLGKIKRFIKLETLYYMFYTQKIGDAHDAKTDVLMCKKIFDIIKLFDKLHKDNGLQRLLVANNNKNNPTNNFANDLDNDLLAIEKITL